MRQRYLNRVCSGAVCCLLLLVMIVSLSIPAHAADKYMECRSAFFDICLDEAGGATVTETWECYFGGDTITRYRRHYSNPDPNCWTMEVLEITMDGFSMEILPQADESRPEGCAAVYETDDTTHIELYLNALDQTHIFTITYYVTNAVILHDDVAEFRYNLSSEHEAFDIDVLDACIEIPRGTADRGLAFWAHGPSESTTFDAMEEDGQVNVFLLHTEEVPADSTVGVRFAMPLQLFPDGTRFESGPALDAILEEEHLLQSPEEPEEWEEDSTDSEADWESGNTDSEEQGPSDILYEITSALSVIWGAIMGLWATLAVVLCVVPALVMLLFSSAFKKISQNRILPKRLAEQRFKPVMAPAYYRSLPDQLKPAMVNRLMSAYPFKGEGLEVQKKGNAFSATLLDLVETGRITAERNWKGELLYRVSSDADGAALTDYEQIVMDILIVAGANKTSMTTAEIVSYMRKNYSWSKDKYRSFDTAVQAAFDGSGLINAKSEKISYAKRDQKFILYYGLFIFIGISSKLGILAGAAMGVLLGLVNAAAIRAFWNLFHPELTLLTQEGENRYAMWKAYANFLRDFTTFQEKNIDDLKIWRKHLVYAAALGCSQQVIENLKATMPELYRSFADDPYLMGYEELYSSASSIDHEGSYTIWTSSSSSSDSGGSSDSDWGGCSDSGGDSDSGSSGSDFD